MRLSHSGGLADQDSIPPPSPGTDHPPLHLATSPASTESLLGRKYTGLPSTPMLDPHTGLLLAVSEANPTPTDLPSMMEAFAQMLFKSLALNAAQITSSIHADLQQIVRMDTTEKKADQSVAWTNQNSARLQDVQDLLETSFAKIATSRTDQDAIILGLGGSLNLRKRVQSAVKSLKKSLIPEIAKHRLELDRAHRALQSTCMDGLPRGHHCKTPLLIIKRGGDEEV